MSHSKRAEPGGFGINGNATTALERGGSSGGSVETGAAPCASARGLGDDGGKPGAGSLTQRRRACDVQRHDTAPHPPRRG